ncbi:dihydrolipoyl dehydrogenase [Cohnella zeiphila]|uniref:Dihydrolipoyl dehydrogenase n=1 Tax=Cohnella zeiphila TaxID=2761120 RepID=A0A7X0VU00_9BACL|nr:dihydrolipoyl dehydrogenase [Cohnella zeiphila]MBB6730491.1 dihydrolipoyl dehydrogenase [Cohnella zeiphila]
MPIEVDVAVLGGGPGGYTAAVRAAQAGKSVALIEKDKLGGTCLHRGCIPSKSLLRSAEVYATVRNAGAYGIELPANGNVSVAWNEVLARKNGIVEQLHRGLQALMKQHRIQVILGGGRIIGPSIFSPRSGAIAVELADGDAETVVPRNLIVATGSRPRRLAGLPYDGATIATSDEALEWETLPASAIIVGGGVIGAEWASMLGDFGTKVTLVEAADRILPGEDKDVSAEMAKLLAARGVAIHAGARLLVESCRIGETGATVEIETAAGKTTLAAEKMLVSVGRQGNVEGQGFENTDIRTSNGFVAVDPVTLQTGERHIYAIGDCIGGVQLAHAAMHEAAVAVDHLLGRTNGTTRTADRDIPRCVYTRPEAASIGWSEAEARAQGREVKTARLPMRIFGKALAYGDAEGFAKVVADRETGDLLGVHLVGSRATDLIAEASLARLLDAVPWEIGRAIHPHPTMSEALQEVMAALDGGASHG